METILIVDDDADLRFNLSSLLQEEGYNIIAVGDAEQAIKEVKTKSPNLVLLDIKLPEMDGMKVLEELKKIDKELIIIMVTAYGEVKDAVKAMKLGAFDYIVKPFDNDEILLIIKNALKIQYLSKEVEVLRKRLGERTAIEEIMGESPQIKQVINQVTIVAPTNMTVIIQGESGTGKELISQMIHQKSKRSGYPFVAVDCGAIPETLVESELFGYEKGAFTGADDRKEGKFEQANNGTLFLDEITNLTDGIQMKLLRVIETRRLQRLGGKRDIQVDVRIIVATKDNLYEAMKTGKFRDDLFHRLNEFHILLPLLRERKEDIPILVKYFLEEANNTLNKNIKGFSSEVMKFFLSYNWPGNVRELKNLVKRAVLLADSEYIQPEYLSLFPSDPSMDGGVNNTLSFNDFVLQQDLEKTAPLRDLTKKASERIEVEVIRQALTRAGGNKSHAAKILKIDRTTLYSKIKKFQLE